MGKVMPPMQGHVVRDFYAGNTHITICDDYCRDKTPEDVERILERISKIAMAEFQRQARNKKSTAHGTAIP